MDYSKAMKLLGMEEGTDFSYIQLTKSFAMIKRGIEDEEILEDIAEAYDYLKSNFKRLKSSNSSHVNVDESIFPKPLKNLSGNEVIIPTFQVMMAEGRGALPISMIHHGSLKIPVIVVGDFIPYQQVAFYHEGILYKGPTEIVYVGS